MQEENGVTADGSGCTVENSIQCHSIQKDDEFLFEVEDESGCKNRRMQDAVTADGGGGNYGIEIVWDDLGGKGSRRMQEGGDEVDADCTRRRLQGEVVADCMCDPSGAIATLSCEPGSKDNRFDLEDLCVGDDYELNLSSCDIVD